MVRRPSPWVKTILAGAQAHRRVAPRPVGETGGSKGKGEGRGGGSPGLHKPVGRGRSGKTQPLGRKPHPCPREGQRPLEAMGRFAPWRVPAQTGAAGASPPPLRLRERERHRKAETRRGSGSRASAASSARPAATRRVRPCARNQATSHHDSERGNLSNLVLYRQAFEVHRG